MTKANPSTERNYRVVVCAALRHLHNGEIICGVRHWDRLMREQTAGKDSWEQGFVDNAGSFLTREEAWEVAEKAGQIVRRVGGDGHELFSENLY